MTEMTKNEAATMYDKVEGIRDLNKVEGFDPRDYMRVLEGQGQVRKHYLDVAYRKLWFRLVYPTGRIEKRLMKLNEGIAVVEARVYLKHDDPEGQYVANAFALRGRNENYGYVESAETAAVGRALADAGFGTQFADMECETDSQLADAPVDGAGAGEQPEWNGMEEAFAGPSPEDGQLPGQYNIEDLLAMEAPDESGTVYGNAGIPEKSRASGAAADRNEPGQAGVVKAASGPEATGKTTSMPVKPEPEAAIKKDMPIEQIYPLLNRETAASVVVSAGFLKGKTLGQVSVEKPESLKWYVESYGGPDNLLRAAAQFLLDYALKQAS